MATLNTRLSHASARPSALIVEDEIHIGEYLADILDDMGFETSAVGTCADALKIVERHGTYTVAFVDLALPDGSGLELISTLQSTHPDLRIVIASGYGSMAIQDTDNNHRPPPVLCKPYSIKVVTDLLTGLGIPIPQLPDESQLSTGR